MFSFPNICHKKLIVLWTLVHWQELCTVYFSMYNFQLCIEIDKAFFLNHSIALSIFQCTIFTVSLDSFIIISLSDSFVKTFFKIFQFFYFVSLASLKWQLIYSTSFYPFCQYFFRLFLLFGGFAYYCTVFYALHHTFVQLLNTG